MIDPLRNRDSQLVQQTALVGIEQVRTNADTKEELLRHHQTLQSTFRHVRNSREFWWLADAIFYWESFLHDVYGIVVHGDRPEPKHLHSWRWFTKRKPFPYEDYPSGSAHEGILPEVGHGVMPAPADDAPLPEEPEVKHFPFADPERG